MLNKPTTMPTMPSSTSHHHFSDLTSEKNAAAIVKMPSRSANIPNTRTSEKNATDGINIAIKPKMSANIPRTRKTHQFLASSIISYFSFFLPY